MRIIAGRWKGRQLLLPPQTITRPTSDRAREAVFSMLTSRLHSFDNVSVFDAFAGSGSLGLEALSRGAKYCVFCEKDVKVRRILETNIKSLISPHSFRESISEIQSASQRSLATYELYSDFKLVLPPLGPFDLIFIDPPYGCDLEFQAIHFLKTHHHIGPHTLLVLETESKQIPSSLDGLQLIVQKKFGRIGISFWTEEKK